MANYDGTITFNGVTLYITNLIPKKVQKTIKTVVGKTLVQTNIIGLGAQQWELELTGIVKGDSLTDLASNRAAIEALDDAESHAYVDGIHDGTYYLVPGSLTFSDSGDRGGMSYVYSFSLVEV